jgi:hypothetical protein
VRLIWHRYLRPSFRRVGLGLLLPVVRSLGSRRVLAHYNFRRHPRRSQQWPERKPEYPTELLANGVLAVFTANSRRVSVGAFTSSRTPKNRDTPVR